MRYEWSGCHFLARQEDFSSYLVTIAVCIPFHFQLYLLNLLTKCLWQRSNSAKKWEPNGALTLVLGIISGHRNVQYAAKAAICFFHHVNHWLNLHKLTLPALRNSRCGHHGWAKYPTFKHTGDTAVLLRHPSDFWHKVKAECKYKYLGLWWDSQRSRRTGNSGMLWRLLWTFFSFF